jgi:undecaprenyl-diphosphatase
MQWWQAVILGMVEGVTEYLPVSSTGHLILTSWFMGFGNDPGRWHAAFTFNIVIQAGAIAAVLVLYWQRVRQMLLGLLGKNPGGKRLAGHLLLAFLPAAVFGVLLADSIEYYLNGPWPVVMALFAGGCLMLAIGYNTRFRGAEGRNLDEVNWSTALLIGASQCLAMWPGTSRSMVTIVAALLLGLRVTAAAEFSFLLGLVTLGAATAFEALRGGAMVLQHFSPGAVLLGFATATVSAALAVSWLVGFLNRQGVAPFGWYRLVIALLFAVLLWSNRLTMPVLQ